MRHRHGQNQKQIFKNRRLIKNIIIETEVANFNFVVGGIPKLLMQMDATKLNMKPQERQRLQVLLKKANSILVGGMAVISGLERINKVLLMAKNGVDDFSNFDNPLDKISSLLVDVAIIMGLSQIICVIKDSMRKSRLSQYKFFQFKCFSAQW